jgi:tetratricopeptide (TPR) repeat protein
VLHYLQTNQEEYDTVLWLDVRSVETARSSFERCCRALDLKVETTSNNVPLHDVPPVQAVLSWLRARSEDQKWLVVLDNADDLSAEDPSLDVSRIVPHGKAGTVIVTSQDARASRLLGGQMATVDVDAMTPEEAVRVLEEHFKSLAYPDGGCRELIEEIAESLDRLAFAIDLAGARIWTDVDSGNDLGSALRQYLPDYRHNQDDLLQDGEYARATPYKKTVWTAWETSLTSLRKLEQSQANIYPIHLLRFMTLLDRSNVQDELFRLASGRLIGACSLLGVEVPAWMQRLLTNQEDGEWNDFPYRTTVNLLLRYGLVRRIAEPWKGITLHSLVQWRASVEMDRDQYLLLYLSFITAVCGGIIKGAEHMRFRRHVAVHLPLKDLLLGRSDLIETKALWWAWSTIGNMLSDEGRWREASELLLQLVDTSSRVFGQEDDRTLYAITSLALTYVKQARYDEAEELYVNVLEVRSRVLGKDHLHTLSAICQRAGLHSLQGRLQEAEELLVRVVDTASRVLGHDHLHTIYAKAALAITYVNQGRMQ